MQVEQQNGIPAVEVLSEFFRFAKASRDVVDEITVEQMDSLRREERCYGSRDENYDSKEYANSFHRRMLIGAGMVTHSKLSEDFVLFSASLPAYQIAEMSCGVACESGRLFEIYERMEVEGLEKGENIRSLETEGEVLLEDIFGTVFCHVLRAYGLDEIANLFEQDPESYHARCDAGRQFIVPN